MYEILHPNMRLQQGLSSWNAEREKQNDGAQQDCGETRPCLDLQLQLCSRIIIQFKRVSFHNFHHFKTITAEHGVYLTGDDVTVWSREKVERLCPILEISVFFHQHLCCRTHGSFSEVTDRGHSQTSAQFSPPNRKWGSVWTQISSIKPTCDIRTFWWFWIVIFMQRLLVWGLLFSLPLID